MTLHKALAHIEKTAAQIAANIALHKKRLANAFLDCKPDVRDEYESSLQENIENDEALLKGYQELIELARRGVC